MSKASATLPGALEATSPAVRNGSVPPVRSPQMAALPGEFECQETVMIGCAQLIRNFPQVFVNLVRAIHRHAKVLCLVSEADETLGRILMTTAEIPVGAVEFLRLPALSMWARDWSPISGYDASGNRRFLAFELSHLRTSSDAGLQPELPRIFRSPLENVPLTHEGGNILSNGDGLCLTSATILLKNTERSYGVREIGRVIQRYFGARQWSFLTPLSGEPTGHVDLFCTFVSRDTVVVGEFDPKHDSINAELLDKAAEMLSAIDLGSGEKLRVVRMPMPPPRDARYRSYTNVCFANGALVVPLYPEIDEAMDRRALEIYRELLPDREVIGLDIMELSGLGGGLHCLTANVCPPTREMRHRIPEPGAEQTGPFPIESAGVLRV